jgi:hypothetical protein
MNCCLHDFGEEVFRSVAEAYVNHEFQVVGDTANWTGETLKSQEDKKYRETMQGTVAGLYHSAVRNGSVKGLPVTISREQIRERLLTHPYCALTRIPFDLCLHRRYRANPFRPSLDRINSKNGYTPDNTRLVCVAVNFALNEFGESTFKFLCERYLQKAQKAA